MDVPGLLSLPMAPNGPALDTLAGAAHAKGPHAVDAVAKDFESMFLSLVLKEMRQTLQSGSFFGEDNSDVYGGLFDLYLSRHLAQAGGFGIAPMLKHQLEAHRPS